MKKKKPGRKFGRESAQRKALMNGLARSLFLKERIKTTEAKAKELRPFAEKLITRAKKSDLSARRYLVRYFDNQTVKKLVEEIAKKYENRPGGYTRIIKLGLRKSDASEMAIIELV